MTMIKRSLVELKILGIVIFLFWGCSEQFLITKQSELRSVNEISYDQFTRLRKGKYFEALLIDSTAKAIQLLSARNDSIIFMDIESGLCDAIPTSSVASLTFRQNDNGLLAAVGGFIGFFLTASLLGPTIDFNDDHTVVGAFVGLIGATAAGAVIGYNIDIEKRYLFKQSKKTTP